MPSRLAIVGPSAGHPFRILLADDNEILRAAIGGLIRALGQSVDAVADGREALASATREDFDFVLLDVQMPRMGGLEAARSLRRGRVGRRAPRIIGISADGRPALDEMDDLLIKPVRLADLVRVLGPHPAP